MNLSNNRFLNFHAWGGQMGHDSLWKVNPTPEPWEDGESITAKIIEAEDFSGNSIESHYIWSWTVDYSQLTGGTLSCSPHKADLRHHGRQMKPTLFLCLKERVIRISGSLILWIMRNKVAH